MPSLEMEETKERQYWERKKMRDLITGACMRGDIDMLKRFVPQVNDESTKAIGLYTAFYSGHLDVVKYLTSVVVPVERYYVDGIKIASKKGYLDVAEFLKTL